MFTIFVIGGVIMWSFLILAAIMMIVKCCWRLFWFLLVKLYDIGRYFLGMEPRRDYDGMIFPPRHEE